MRVRSLASLAVLLALGLPAVAAPVPRESLAPGRFGKALDARVSSAEATPRPEYQKPPFTVECWARLFSKDRFNVLVAKNRKESAEHWEIYSYAGTGEFSALDFRCVVDAWE